MPSLLGFAAFTAAFITRKKPLPNSSLPEDCGCKSPLCSGEWRCQNSLKSAFTPLLLLLLNLYATSQTFSDRESGAPIKKKKNLDQPPHKMRHGPFSYHQPAQEMEREVKPAARDLPTTFTLLLFAACAYPFRSLRQLKGGKKKKKEVPEAFLVQQTVRGIRERQKKFPRKEPDETDNR